MTGSSASVVNTTAQMMDDRVATTPNFVGMTDDNIKNVWSVGNVPSNDGDGHRNGSLMGIRKNSGNGPNFDARIWYKNK